MDNQIDRSPIEPHRLMFNPFLIVIQQELKPLHSVYIYDELAEQLSRKIMSPYRLSMYFTLS